MVGSTAAQSVESTDGVEVTLLALVLSDPRVDDLGFDRRAEFVIESDLSQLAGGENAEYPFAPAAATPSLLQPALYVLGLQALELAILTAQDPEKTGFEPPHIRNVFRAVSTPPVRDGDSWYTNFIGHPLAGSEYYLSVRRNGYAPTEAFLFSTAASLVWEYLIEAWFEQPSIQDLLTTSPLGSIIGELRFHALVALAGRDEAWARAAMFALDPLRSLASVTGLKIHVGLAIRPETIR
jgi:hypothetical protein